VSKAEHRLPSRSRRAGIVATLTSFRGRDGRGTPAPRLLLLALVFALCAFGFGVASATAEAPQVTTPEVSEISYTTAHVKAKIDRGGEGTGWYFEVSTDGSNWERTNVEGFTEEGTGLQTVEGDITSLKPGTTYQIRVTAQNGSATVTSAEPNPEFTTKTLPAPTVSIDPVTTFTGTTATFSGTINPNAPAGNPQASEVEWHFQCTPDCPNVSIASSPTPNPIPADAANHVVSGKATGLEPNTTYEVTLVGSNAGGPVEAGPVSFKTAIVAPGAQTIPAFVLEGGTSALLGARINPHNSSTKYWFELEGPVGGAVAIPATEDASAGNGGSAQFVTQKALNLSPATTYHFKVIATSAGGTSEGASVPFTTPTPAPAEGECANKQFRVGPSASLPDCRAFELASAPDLLGYSIKRVATRNGETVTPFPAVAEDGNATLWGTDGLRSENDSDGLYDNYISRRTPDGWRSEFVSPPGSKVAQEPLLAYADPNFDRLVWDTGAQRLDPTDPDAGLVSEGTSGGGTYSSTLLDLMRREPDGQYARLSKGPAETRVASEPGTGSEAGKQFNTEPAQVVGAPRFSKDGMHVAFSWKGPKLTSDGFTGDKFSLGAYVGDGQTTTAITDPTSGQVEIAAISDDGGTIAYVVTSGGSSEHFLKIRTDGLTRTINVGEFNGFSGNFLVWYMSGDGQSLVYSSSEQETSDDTDSSFDLYEYDLSTETSHRLSAPTGAPTGPDSGNSDNCPGSWSGRCSPIVSAVSNDGSKVYFVSPELLDGDRGVEGEPNLYYREGGATTYVGSLVAGDEARFGGPYGGPFGGFVPAGVDIGLGGNGAQFTPDQSKLIFQSKARLTAYDNHEFKEIYVYDPAADELSCASCRLNGSQPAGDTEMRLSEQPYEFKAPTAPVSIVASDDSGGHIFFATYDSLRPGDTDQRSDVYSVDVDHGTIAALGNLTDDQDNYFWGAAVGGRDVFIASTSRLTEEEKSTGAYKLWDARIGGGFAPPLPPPSETCEGDPCHGTGSEAPASAGSGSSRFEGPADPPVKHKKKHKKHRKHHKHKKHHKHGKGKKHAAKHGADDKRRNH
jgi:hypothetical protein